MKARDKITHFEQEKNWSCGAAALAAFLNATELEVRCLLKTDSKGTHDYMVARVLKELGFNCHYIQNIKKDYRELFWLPALCCRWPIYLSCEFKDQGKRGRPSLRRHAVLAANGCFYDPSEDRAYPISAFEHTFSKYMKIMDMILIEHELPEWRQNLEKYT